MDWFRMPKNVRRLDNCFRRVQFKRQASPIGGQIILYRQEQPSPAHWVGIITRHNPTCAAGSDKANTAYTTIDGGTARFSQVRYDDHGYLATRSHRIQRRQ